MQLLKVRDFSAMFTDTFTFIKENAAHFFTNFFIINSLFILTYGVYNYFVSRFMGQNFEEFNPMYTFLFIVVFIVLAIIYWTFSPIYMILYQKHETQFNATDILNMMKGNAGKIVVFILISIVMGILILIPLVLVSFILMITIVGIFALPILFAALALWFQLAFMEYINSDKTYFEAFGYAYTLFMKKFWASVGSNAILQMVIMAVYYLLAGIFGLFSAFSNFSSDPENAMENMQKIMSSPTMLILSVVMIVVSSLVYINIGIIYFSQKEDMEGINAKLSIDDIGKNDYTN